MTYEEAVNELDNLIDEWGITFKSANEELYATIKAALEKQIQQRVEYVKGAGIMFCPNCSSYLTGYKYCCECGQAVDIDNRREKQ